MARQMARLGRLPAYQPGGQRAWVFHRDEVLAWVKAHPAVTTRTTRMQRVPRQERQVQQVRHRQ
ncbi:MAG: hypothetical protein HKN95_11700 [Acidimicrobiia bacterium]|nr:hypothetical protein [Acidimicrobiia bacterium]